MTTKPAGPRPRQDRAGLKPPRPARESRRTHAPSNASERRTYSGQLCRAATRCIEKSKVRLAARNSRCNFKTRRRDLQTAGASDRSQTEAAARLGRPRRPPGCLVFAPALLLVVCVSQLSSQQLLYFNSPPARSHAGARPVAQQGNRRGQLEPMTASGSAENTALTHWRSQHQTPIGGAINRVPPDASPAHLSGAPNEPRGALSRNLYSRGPRNASFSAGSGAGSGGSWHFPRISPEQAAEVLITGAQVINKIAQADSPLNYCRTPDNQEGECSDIRKCIWLVLDKARLKQSVCLRNLFIPAVCCPISNANNTPIANMIQSTLEPVLFRPKGPKQKGGPAKPGEPAGGQQQPGPVSSSVWTSSAAVTAMPSAPVVASGSLVIKNPSSQPPAASTTTTTTTAATTDAQPTSVLPAIAVAPSGQDLAPVNAPLQESAPSTGGVAQHSSTFKPAGQYLREKSSKYSWANETCGEGSRTRTGRIVGGSDSKLGQWPWMTAMYLNKRNAFTSGAGEFWCGGALINRRFILTAAHCLSDQRGNRYKNDQVTIKLGGVDLVRHQAPADMLRNAELGPPEAPQQRSLMSQPQQFFTTHLSPHTSKQNRRSTGGASWTNYRGPNGQSSGRTGEDDEEFSWTSFITKALGLVGVGSGGSSSSPTAPVSPSAASPNGSAKSLDSNKRQQLAAHARKTYFKEYKVANIKQHPKFQRHGFYNDIGLIELKSDVDFDELVSPVCLPTEHDLKRDLTGYMATVLGWGTLSYGGQGSKLLQQVSMPVWSNKDCDERYLQHIGNTFLCAGFLTGGKDACQGDSGGPLMVSDQSGRWTLHGIVSFGKQCGLPSYPGVFSRVTQYLDWIEENTKANLTA